VPVVFDPDFAFDPDPDFDFESEFVFWGRGDENGAELMR
jgi:hypothetical protein